MCDNYVVIFLSQPYVIQLNVLSKFYVQEKKVEDMSLFSKIWFDKHCYTVFSCFPSIYEGELRQKHQFFLPACRNDKRTKTHQYSLTDKRKINLMVKGIYL